MLHVIAILTAKPGRRAELLAAFLANVPAVRAEAGCIEYVATSDADGAGDAYAKLGPDAFLVVEKWESQEALTAHGRSAHMSAYRAATKDLLAEAAIYVLAPA